VWNNLNWRPQKGQVQEMAELLEDGEASFFQSCFFVSISAFSTFVQVSVLFSSYLLLLPFLLFSVLPFRLSGHSF